VVPTADDPETFAAHCIALLKDPAHAEDLARRGHARIDAQLDFPMFASIVDQAVDQALAPRNAGRSTPVTDRAA